MTVLLGNGDGTFKAPVTIASPSGFTMSIAAADLNGDGKPDLVVSNEENPAVMANYSGLFLSLLGNGDGTFTNAPGTGSEFQPSAASMAIADFNGDGKPDLAMTSELYDAITIQLGNGGRDLYCDASIDSDFDGADAGDGRTSMEMGFLIWLPVRTSPIVRSFCWTL